MIIPCFGWKYKKKWLLDFSDSDSDFEPVKPKMLKAEKTPASSNNVVQCIDLTVAQSDRDVAVGIIQDLKEVATIIQDPKELATRIAVIDEELSRAVDIHDKVERVRRVRPVQRCLNLDGSCPHCRAAVNIEESCSQIRAIWSIGELLAS